MTTFKVDGKDIPLTKDFSENTSGRIGVVDLLQSALEQFYDTEFGKMLKDFNLEYLVAKLKAGDLKTIAICSITILCFGLSYLVLKEIGAPVEKEEKIEVEVEKIEQRDFTIEQLVRSQINKLNFDPSQGTDICLPLFQQRDYDGKGEQPIYIALKGDVFDVSSAREFYGEGSGYAIVKFVEITNNSKIKSRSLITFDIKFSFSFILC